MWGLCYHVGRGVFVESVLGCAWVGENEEGRVCCKYIGMCVWSKGWGEGGGGGMKRYVMT